MNRLGSYVLMRPSFSEDGHAIWLCNRTHQQTISVAKPVVLEYEPLDGSYALPEPTLFLPRMVAKEFYEKMTEQIKYSGEPWMEAYTAMMKQEAHIKDLQKYLDRAFSLLEKK